jgi:membrane protease subunit HflC
MFTVGLAEHAVVTEFGRPVRVVSEPGLGLKRPYQGVRKLDGRLRVASVPAGEYLTVEKTSVMAAADIYWRIADPQRFLQTVFDPSIAERRLGEMLAAELGAAAGRNSFAAFVALEREAFRADAVMAEVAHQVGSEAASHYGIEVVDVRLRSFDFPRQNRLRLYARMKSERGQLSMRYRSEGEEQGLKIRAAADAEREHLLAEALKVAQSHRGEGEAAATRIYAEALAQSPEFFRFLQSSEAARTVLARKGVSLVLPADAELFGLLRSSDYFEQPEASGAAADAPR